MVPTMVPYSPEVFEVDDPDYQIPPYDPLISRPGNVDGGAQVEVVSQWEVQTSQQTAQQEGALQNVPTYEEVTTTGWDVAGGTTVLDAPQPVAEGFYRTIIVRWHRQTNLTNLSHYEVQVADNPSGPWYELRGDGVDWKGTQDDVTRTYGEYVIHENIPHAGTAEDPQPRTLYYRVRSVTKTGTVSPWSTVLSASTHPIAGPDILAHTITAEKINTDVLNALIANIKGELRVDLDGWSAEAGNIKTSVREDGLHIWNGGVEIARYGADEGWHRRQILALNYSFASPWYTKTVLPLPTPPPDSGFWVRLFKRPVDGSSGNIIFDIYMMESVQSPTHAVYRCFVWFDDPLVLTTVNITIFPITYLNLAATDIEFYIAVDNNGDIWGFNHTEGLSFVVIHAISSPDLLYTTYSYTETTPAGILRDMVPPLEKDQAARDLKTFLYLW